MGSCNVYKSPHRLQHGEGAREGWLRIAIKMNRSTKRTRNRRGLPKVLSRHVRVYAPETRPSAQGSVFSAAKCSDLYAWEGMSSDLARLNHCSTLLTMGTVNAIL